MAGPGPGPVGRVAVVEALLLRTKFPELTLREGAGFLARVASRGERGTASLVVAGELITATVPEEVREGQTLRLTVAEVTPERITLRMDAGPAAALAPPPPAPPRLAVEERPAARGAGPAREAAVTLTYETAALGRVRVRVTTAPGAVGATVQVPAAVLAAAQERAGRLRDDLAAQVGRPATVHVVAGSVDVRA